jgi:hypothetical protein
MTKFTHPMQSNPFPMTLKGICRRFRTALHAAGKTFPLSGAFTIKIGNKIINHPDDLPTLATLKRSKVEIINSAPGTILASVPKKKTEKPAPVVIVDNDRPLYKRTVREADPNNPKSKRRVDYRLAKNPKPGDGVTYYAKIEGKWREVPAAYADPNYNLPGVEAVAV